MLKENTPACLMQNQWLLKSKLGSGVNGKKGTAAGKIVSRIQTSLLLLRKGSGSLGRWGIGGIDGCCASPEKILKNVHEIFIHICLLAR